MIICDYNNFVLEGQKVFFGGGSSDLQSKTARAREHWTGEKSGCRKSKLDRATSCFILLR